MNVRRVQRGGWIAFLLVVAVLIFVSVRESRLAGPALPWTPYERALARARAEQKPILLKFHADWCTWCRKMERTTFRDSEVRRLAEAFVCAQVDTDREPALARQYGVFELPVTLLLTPDGGEMGRVIGYVEPERLSDAMGVVLKRKAK